MKYISLFINAVVLLCFLCSFQTKEIPDNDSKNKKQNPVTNPENNPPIYLHVEKPPKFLGKKVEAYKLLNDNMDYQITDAEQEIELVVWLNDNVIYPTIAWEQGIQGMVATRFVIKPDGSIGNIEITKSLHPVCDSAAIQAIRKMPKWIPGRQGDNPVHFYFSLPVIFELLKFGKRGIARISTKSSTTTLTSPRTKSLPYYIIPGRLEIRILESRTQALPYYVVLEKEGKVLFDEEFSKFDQQLIDSILENNRGVEINTKKR